MFVCWMSVVCMWCAFDLSLFFSLSSCIASCGISRIRLVSVFKSFSLFLAGPVSPFCVIYSSQLIPIQRCAASETEAFVSFQFLALNLVVWYALPSYNFLLKYNLVPIGKSELFQSRGHFSKMQGEQESSIFDLTNFVYSSSFIITLNIRPFYFSRT